jgi:hypothetical protein
MALISGYHMMTGAAPNGEFAFGRGGRRVLRSVARPAKMIMA